MTVQLPQVAEHGLSFGVDFTDALGQHGRGRLTGTAITTLQINVGKLCNQACHHCHVDAGPKRTEQMSAEIADRVMALMDASPAIAVVDITGGAPELNGNFRTMASRARAAGKRVIDRCNLTVLFEPGQEDLAQFLADQGIEITASLPCYSASNVDKQRGKGAFGKSIEALQQLNRLGYGQPGSGLQLDLVYNPVGPSLPPPQQSLEADYKQRLKEDFGIVFNSLYTITNMPISRFAHSLERDGKWSEYMSLLVNHFNPGTVDGLMCRHQVSIGYDGTMYDCDFNQMLGIEVSAGTGHFDQPPTVWDINSFVELHDRPIAVDGHCFGCTAGAGSSCGGALT
ncbi:MAG: arsenosugar biosynthesis radical SAM (seleno)protein ArsS [Myxococcota bacterium]